MKRNRKPFTKEEQDYIFENYKGVSGERMAEKLKERFGTQCSREKVKNFYKRHSLVPDARSFRKSPFSKEEEEFILKNYKGASHEKMRELLIVNFGKRHSETTIGIFYRENGLKSGLDGRFQKGQVSMNKGVPMVKWAKPESIERIRKTQFKKGHINDNAKPLLPIGSRRIRSDGYVWIKTGQPNTWREEHRYLWERKYGPLPRYQKMLHIDGNRANNDLDNLMLVSNAVCAEINNRIGLTKDRELNLVIISLAKLRCRSRERQTE